MSRTFTVQLNDNSEHIPRAARRVIFNPDFLKAAKLCTGDVVALSSGENSAKKVGINFLILLVLTDATFLIEVCSGGCVAIT